MSEVAVLQVIGLGVVGTGIAILLFIQSRFPRVIGFVMIVLGIFSLISLSVPQMASLPPAEETFDVASIKTASDMAAIGQKIFFSKGQCALCHSIGPSESARCPDLKGIGAKLTREFIYESLTRPQAYIYLDYRHEGPPKEYPARMPYINKNPIGLTKNEILSVIAFLQQMSGEPITVSPSEIEMPGEATPPSATASTPVPLAQPPAQGRAKEKPRKAGAGLVAMVGGQPLR
jgi:mono/diheme cytochrome c family protein